MKVSVEFLYHFSCDDCRKWWSIADFSWSKGVTVVCPHCGHREAVTADPLLLTGHLLDTKQGALFPSSDDV